jgi:hypothetical protein
MQLYKSQEIKTFILAIVLLMSSLFCVADGQLPTPNPADQPNQTRLSDEKWTNRVFQKLLLPLNEEQISILQKQLKLTNEQINLIKKLNSSYSLQQKLLKETSRLSLGEISANKVEISNLSDEVKSNYSDCLQQAKQLRDSLGSKDNDFLSWIRDEVYIGTNLPWISETLKNPSPEDIVSTFIKELNKNRNVKKRDAENDWWFKKRCLFWACGFNLPLGEEGKAKRIELSKKRETVLQEMMSH